MKYLPHLLLIIILLIAAFLRLSYLSLSPPSLNWDEAAWGYNAYSIIETGKDEYGVGYPIFTRSFDEYKPMLPTYLMIPSILVFGLNEIGVRLPSAVIGVLIVFMVYLISKNIFRSTTVALLSSFSIAISPWAVHLSRVYHDANIAMFLILVAVFLTVFGKKGAMLLPLAIILFMLSMFTYNANKLLVPLVIMGLFIWKRKKILKYPFSIKVISILILVISFSVFLYLAAKGQALARVTSTNIFILWPYTNVLKDIKSSHTSLFDALFHSQIFYFSWEVVGRFFAYFSPPNLFVREPLEPATVLAGNSLFHPHEFLPWLVGLISVIINFKKQKLLIMLLLMAPIPAVITWNWFQPGRVLLLFTLYSIFIGLGYKSIINYITKKVPFFSFIRLGMYAAVIGVGILSAFYVLDSLIVQLPYRDPGNWQPGFKESVPFVFKEARNYNEVVVETPHAQPYIFYLFYGKYSPKDYLAQQDLQKIGTPRKNYDFGKFIFRKINWEEDIKMKNTLFVGTDNNLPDNKLDASVVDLTMKLTDKYGNPGAKLVGTKD